MVERLVSLAAGVLLASALLCALPRAFESQADRAGLCATLLAGLLGFFLIEKLFIVRHASAHGADRSWVSSLADGMYDFTRGLLVVAALHADPQLLVGTVFALSAQRVARTSACTLLRASMALLGGMVAYLMLELGMASVPHVLVAASAGFIYIALGKLMPRMKHGATPTPILLQVGMLAVGIATVVCLSGQQARL
jgi:zinc and cadmium transporter